MSVQLPQKEEDIVRFLYLAILKREPDPVGLKHYAEKLRSKELDVPTLVHVLYTSDENRNKRQAFREAAKLALWDFLNAIKGTVVYDYLNELAMLSLYSRGMYSDTTFAYDFAPGSLVVTNTMIPVRSDIHVYTTSDELRQLMKMNGLFVIDSLWKVSNTYENCYFVNPEMFDVPGAIARKLDEICEVVMANGMSGYIRSRLRKAKFQYFKA